MSSTDPTWLCDSCDPIISCGVTSTKRDYASSINGASEEQQQQQPPSISPSLDEQGHDDFDFDVLLENNETEPVAYDAAAIDDVEPFVDCIFDSSIHHRSSGILGVWWGYNNTGSAVSIPSLRSSNNWVDGTISHSAIKNQPTTFFPGVHRYAFVSYFNSSAPSTWIVGSSRATTSPLTAPKCRDRVFIQPRLECIKEFGVHSQLSAKWSYSMISLESDSAVVPFLEIPADAVSNIISVPTSLPPTQLFYYGDHVRQRYFVTLLAGHRKTDFSLQKKKKPPGRH
jgi:hypothetical protein